MILLRNARLVRRGQVLDGGWLTIADGRISAVGGPGVGGPDVYAESGENAESAETGEFGESVQERFDLAGHFLLPGFVDMHTHGGAGASFGATDPGQARIAAEYHLGQGTTTLLASTVTEQLTELEQQLPVLAELTEQGVLAGIHLEGPFIAAGRCGAHDPDLLRDPEPDVLARLLEAGRGAIRMVTLAPELDHAIEAIRLLVDHGVVPAFGHTDATYAQTWAAIDAGARVATHSFNGMRPIHHREPGPMIAAMERAEVVLEVVNDGVHVHPAMVRHLVNTVGADRVALVSDAMSAAGAPDGRYRLGPMTVVVTGGVARIATLQTGASHSDSHPSGTSGTAAGTAATPVTGSVAGSTITLSQAVRNAVRAVGIPIWQAAEAAALTPARALGIDDRVGSLEPGKDADLVVLDQELAVVGVIRKGRWVCGGPLR
jgi:N-acetylglucosamine-6-phosphate deacetylase